MSCKWLLHFTLTIVVVASTAGLSFGQYQGYASSPQPPARLPQVDQTPWWNSVEPAASQNSPRQSAPGPYAHSPSEMPSVNPFANVRSRQQQMPVQYGSLPYQPAASAYDAYPTSFAVQHQSAAGDVTPYAGPTEQLPPAPQPHSYYDQPALDYWQQPAYGVDAKAKSCSTAPGGQCSWYASAVGLIFTRDRENNLWLSYDINDASYRVLNSHDAGFNYSGGSGASIGHYFNCGRNSIEFVYWGIYPGQSEANAYWSDTAGGLDTILHLDGLEYDAGAGSQALSNFFFDAERHRVQRDYRVYNFELNLLGHNFVNGCGPWQLGWTAGVRYLRFDEDFLYSSDGVDTVFTGDPEELHYSIDVENNLIGFQMGGRADYCVCPRLKLFANTKVGIYGNHVNHRSRISGANGLAWVGDAGSPYYGEDVDVTSSKDDFAMIGDLSVGGTWCISPCWSINAGYRAVAVNGVALSTNQVPVDFIGAIDSVRAIDSNGCLLLHGAFAGINFCY